MNETILLFGMPSMPEMLVLLVIVMLIFGGSKLPQLAKALGQSKRAFKEGMDEADAEAAEANKRREQISDAPKPALAAVDDEALFEEARRRAQAIRAAEVKPVEK